MICRWFERYPATLFTLMALTCLGLVIGGVFIEAHIKEENPFSGACTMCVFQRFLYVIIVALGVLAAISAHISKKTIPIFAFLTLLVSGTGIYTAAKQSWMQWYPTGEEVCGISGDTIYAQVSRVLGKVSTTLFEAVGDCEAVDWSMFKLTIANWSFIAFTCCFIAMLIMLFKGGKCKKGYRSHL